MKAMPRVLKVISAFAIAYIVAYAVTFRTKPLRMPRNIALRPGKSDRLGQGIGTEPVSIHAAIPSGSVNSAESPSLSKSSIAATDSLSFMSPPTDDEILAKLNRLPQQPRLLIMNTYINNGRLGNQLFEYAGLLALAIKYNRTPVIPSTSIPDVYGYFDLHMAIINETVAWSGPVVTQHCVGCILQFEQLLEHRNENISVTAYFQSWKYVEPISRFLREREFRYKPDIYQSAVARRESVISAVAKKSESRHQVDCILIGVHNRRGDITTKHNHDIGFPLAGVDYFNRTMTFYHQKYQSHHCILFAVVSDEYTWAVENIERNLGNLFQIVVLKSSANPAVDHCFLTLCDHHIITSGTFGWWAGYLGKGDVVYMKNYPIPGSHLAKVHFAIPSDYYPASWMPM